MKDFSPKVACSVLLRTLCNYVFWWSEKVQHVVTVKHSCCHCNPGTVFFFFSVLNVWDGVANTSCQVQQSDPVWHVDGSVLHA